jgi:hypothetical protein
MMLHTTEQEAKAGGGETAEELDVENLGKLSVSS